MSARYSLANARTERVHQLAARPDGVSAAEVADAVSVARGSVLYVISRAKLAYGLVRVRRPGTRGWRWFADAEQAKAWAARPDTTCRNGYPKASSAAPAERPAVRRPDRSRVDVPPVPGWGGPPARRAGADDWRRCGNVLLGQHRQGAAR